MEKLASEAEMAAAKGQLSSVYKITKQFSGQRNICTKLVKDKQGRETTMEREQALRWAKHFEELLNRPDPEEQADPEPLDDTDINTDLSSQAGVETAVKQMKKRKAPGIASLEAELLMADITAASKVLTELFAKIWEQNVFPKD